MSRYHIAMIAPFGIRPKGTLLARMLPLAQALHRRGHQVTIVAPPVHNPQDAGTQVVQGGVPVIHTAHTPGPVGMIVQSNALLQTALRAHPDLVHVFKPKGYAGFAALAARLTRPRLPLILDTDDWEGPGGWNDLLPYPAPAKALFAWQEHDLPRRAHAVTVASPTLQSLVWSMGVPAERVLLLPNGIVHAPHPPSLPRDPHAVPQLVLYTRFWEFAREELVAALVAIHQARPDARLVVIGRGEAGEEQHFAQLAAQAGLSAMITQHGWLEPAHIPPILAASDLALAPIRDTLINRARGMAKLLELLGAGVPVVANDVGIARDYIGSGGILTPPGDPAAFASAVVRLLNDPALRQQAAYAARTAVVRYAWDALAPTAEAAYALGKRNAHRA
jgi:glycosyltransferase involved in cell wall biosynthesis